MKRFTTSSLLNFLGLTGAIAVFIICFIQVNYDYTYNHNFENAEQIVQAYIYEPHTNEYSEFLNTPFSQKISTAHSQVKGFTNIQTYDEVFKVAQSTESQVSMLTFVNKGFITLFKPKVIVGDISETFISPGHAALSESTALQLFGTIDVLGKTITEYYNTDNKYIIDAIIKDFPKNCSLSNGVFTKLENGSIKEYTYKAYYLIDRDYLNEVEQLINTNDFLEIDSKEISKQANNEYHFLPLKEYNLNKNFGGNRKQMYTFALVGFIVLLIAYINYVNFALTTAPARIKTLNIQRIHGLNKHKQRGVLMAESCLFTLVAFTAALGIVFLLSTSTVSQLFSADMTFNTNKKLFLFIGSCLIGLGLLIGYYPAWYSTSFKETEAIKGRGLNTISSHILRNSLLTIQLCAAFALPVITSFVYLQYNYMVNYEWGIEKENIVYFNTIETNQQFESLAKQLTENPNIIDYTGSQFIPGSVAMEWGVNWQNQYVSFKAWPVTPNFLDFFGVELNEGESFPAIEDGIPRMIVNEMLITKYIPNRTEAIGTTFTTGLPTIIGIAKDVNFTSLHMEIEPMAFITKDSQNKEIMFLKLAKEVSLQETISWIKNIIEDKAPSQVELNFLDKDLDKLYREENNQAKLITYFSLIIIIITLMGVYGLISFNVKYKEKEIALRKINGANENQIVLMLNKNLFSLFIVAYAIAIPVAYYLSKLWINQFAYRIELHWWVFVVNGLLVILITLFTVSIKSYRAAIKNPIESLQS